MKKLSIAIIILLCGLQILGCVDGGSALPTPGTETEANAAQTESEVPAETPAETEALTEKPAPAETEAPAETPAPCETEMPAENEDPIETEPLKEEISLSWAKAFRISTLPEGVLTPDEIAFYSVDESDTAYITNVPKKEVFAYHPERLPRSRTLEKYIPDNLDTLLVTLDYALAHGYSRFSIPTTEFCYGDILNAHQMLNRIYYLDNKGLNSLDVQSFETENDETLTYVLVTISGLPNRYCTQLYHEAFAAAEKIVATVPEGSSEFQTALYLYRYLTDNVEYDNNEYYENGKQLILYDALVKHKTVCAGYTEALYYLYNLAGIDCMIVSGYICDPQPRGYHVWNVACIDGKYYQFDSTWDSQLLPCEYAYFAVSDEYMMEHHTQNVETLSLQYMPECPDSLFPDISLVTKTVAQSGQMVITYIYYRFLTAKETDPLNVIMNTVGIDPSWIPQYDAGDGWVVTGMEYESFQTLLSVLLDKGMIDRFCEGYYKEQNGLLLYRKPIAQPIGWRVCEMTENADGSILTKSYYIDEMGIVQQTAEHLVKFKDGKLFSFAEQ